MLPFKVTLSLSMMYVSIARIGGDVTAVILMVAINSLSGGVDRMRCGLYLLLLRCWEIWTSENDHGRRKHYGHWHYHSSVFLLRRSTHCWTYCDRFRKYGRSLSKFAVELWSLEIHLLIHHSQGNGMNSSTIPVYQSETSPAAHRGALLTLEGTVTILGLCIGEVIGLLLSSPLTGFL